MKKIALALILALTVLSCNNDDDTVVPQADVSVDFTFTQNWDGQNIVNSDYQNTTYVNANGESMTLSKINYLISDITFTSVQDQTVYAAEDYNLVLARDAENTVFTPNIEIPQGDYIISFTFGFDDEDNDKEGGYNDLNSVDGFWSVPEMLGGGYHYQRIEGTYINNTDEITSFQFHTVRANKHSSLPPGPGTLDETNDTSFEVNLGTVSVAATTTVEVKANISEWFKDPVTWNLNERFMVLMPNFQAQLDMNQNGKTVFELGAVTQ